MQPGDLLWDADVKGFGVRDQGGRKTYVLKARINGRQRCSPSAHMAHRGRWKPPARKRSAYGAISAGGSTWLRCVRTVTTSRPSPIWRSAISRTTRQVAKRRRVSTMTAGICAITSCR
ncbi:MAG: hypothetical protein HC850_02405 [Rhodomicrobium sp.]|nr:hypothetical protein [Rhodomicrobium sp.]